MKIICYSENIRPFGGFNFLFKTFKDSGLSHLIDNYPGVKAKVWDFPSGIVLPATWLFFPRGQTTEVINEHSRKHLQQVKGLEVCSAATPLREIEKPATDSVTVENPVPGVKLGFIINKKLNKLLMKSLKKIR